MDNDKAAWALEAAGEHDLARLANPADYPSYEPRLGGLTNERVRSHLGWERTTELLHHPQRRKPSDAWLYDDDGNLELAPWVVAHEAYLEQWEQIREQRRAQIHGDGRRLDEMSEDERVERFRAHRRRQEAYSYIHDLLRTRVLLARPGAKGGAPGDRQLYDEAGQLHLAGEVGRVEELMADAGFTEVDFWHDPASGGHCTLDITPDDPRRDCPTIDVGTWLARTVAQRERDAGAT